MVTKNASLSRVSQHVLALICCTLLFISPVTASFSSKACVRPKRNRHASECWSQPRHDILSRRSAVLLLLVTGLAPLPALGDVDELNKIITTSDFGLSVRESVVRGAQVMDKLDGKWEKFSDSFGLGAQRAKQPGRPKEKKIPPRNDLDISIAREIIQASDLIFSEITGISKTKLQTKVADMMELVRPSFQRSASQSLAGEMISAEQFNFISYAHFRTYGDLLLEYKTDFVPFRQSFEQRFGETLFNLLEPNYTLPRDTGLSKTDMLANRLLALESVEEIMVDKGLVAQIDQSAINNDRIKDWAENEDNISFTVALDLDATLGAQLLLEEQGFRLLPCYARFLLLFILRMADQDISIDPYYFDTNYNSDPSLFEVKEILLNVVIESAL